MKLVSVSFFLSAALVALAACQPADVVQVDPALEPAIAAETPEPIQVAEKRGPLPDCASVQADLDNSGQISHVDCRGMFPGDAGLAYEARYAPIADGMTEVKVEIVGPGDAGVQTIAEQMEGTIAQPALQDIDADGRTDLLVPLMTGNVNTSWAVWRGLPDGAFGRAGELSGVEIARSKGGKIASVARSGANLWEVSFFDLEADKLLPIATAEVEIQLTDTGTQTESCKIRDDGGLERVKMSPIQAEKTFCMDPLVSGVAK